jgi:arylformamidase
VPFSFRSTSSLVEGSPYESTCFTMSAHLGTHVDAPSHVLRDGASVGELSLHPFIGPACVVLLPGTGEIGPGSLPARSIGEPRVLFRTNGKAFLSPLAALRLAEKGAILIGTDAASIDPEDAEDLPVHRALLSRHVALLEGLVLSHVEPGDYGLVAVPLAFESLDASPVRAVLVRVVPEKKKPRPAP